MSLGPLVAPLEVSMSPSFFSDMPSAPFDCLSKAFAKTTGHFFVGGGGGDQPTQGYKPFI